ncbi:MAG: DUF6562 domain-containing protein [Bacteroides eggerthii]
MKKYHLYLWIIALVGLMTSCSQDETDALQTATESNRVTLTASLPEDFAQPQPQSRALPAAPADHKLRCILEVWTQDESPVLKHREEKVNLTGDNVVFDFTIDEGTYDCLFWADFIATDAKDLSATIGDLSYTHYDDKFYATNNSTNGLKAISIIANNIFNTDARDAFFGHYVLDKQTAAVTNPSIPALTRPFAKLTIKEKNATNYGYCNGLTATYNVPTMFNVLDGTVSGTAQVICRSKSTEQQTLFSDYILTDASSTLGSIDLTFTGTKDLQSVTIPAGIPLKRNYKTNAAGSLISEKPEVIKDVKLTVTMDGIWTGTEEEIIPAKVGDYYYKDGTWSTDANATSANPILGVIYKVNADGTGKVVSLTEGTNLTWGPRNVETQARSETNGKENTDKVFALIANQSYTLSDYPIFNACQELRTSTGNDGWYIPSPADYKELFNEVNNINNKITAISGGTAVVIPTQEVRTTHYWTSEEYDIDDAIRITAAAAIANELKHYDHKVRFVLDF